jgi:hypothetical protein
MCKKDFGKLLRAQNLVAFILMLFVATVVRGQTGSNEKSIADLINPEQLKETFIYWREDLLVIVPGLMDNRKVIRAFHTPLNPNSDTQLNYDNDILDWHTLRPLEKQTAAGSLFYDYSKAGEVTLKFVTSKETVSRTIKIDKPNYNLRGPASGVLTASLPLKIGFKTRFSEIRLDFPYRPNYDHKIIDYSLQVIGEEKITVDNQLFDTYIVEIEPELSGTGVYFKSWVTKNAPHHAVQFIYDTKKGGQRPPFVIGGIFVKTEKQKR